jgi:hypothetical protein
MGIVLISIISIALVITVNWFNNQSSNREFFVGVEYAYGSQASEVKNLVDKVRNYTNLFVIGSIEVTFNETALNESCDYIFSAGLNIIVLFVDSTRYNYDIFAWMTQAKQKYGAQFLGVYRFDEPGGDQLDDPALRFVEEAANYTDAAAKYVNGLELHVDYYKNYVDRMFTADYGLYWFDYEAQYTAIFAEFVGNQSRQLHMALCRGAARAHNKDWGVIVTWKYSDKPYLENGTELYNDLTLAYDAGAKYVVVFSYPQIGSYGTLTKDHFDALNRFWSYIHGNPQFFGSTKAEAAYVVPKDYGFGFRSADDTVWGLFSDKELSAKLWNDVNKLKGFYGAGFDIIYDEPGVVDAARNRYYSLFFWNETVA